LETLDFRENKPEPFKEFIFYIDNAKITVLSDKGTERTGDGVTNSEYAHFHFHLFYELFYVNEGKFTIKFENGEKEFEKDDLIIVAPGTNHRTIMIDPGTSRYNINFLMEKTSIKTEFSLYDALTKSLVEPFVCLKNCSALREVLKKLSRVDIVAEGGLIICEAENDNMNSDIHGFTFVKKYNYGRTNIAIYTKHYTEDTAEEAQDEE